MPDCSVGDMFDSIAPSVIDDAHITACLQEYFSDESLYVPAEPNAFEVDESHFELVYEGPHYFIVEGADPKGWEKRSELWLPGRPGQNYRLVPQVLEEGPAYVLDGSDF